MDQYKLSLLLFGEGFDTTLSFLELVEKCELVGINRLWLAEHYSFGNLWCNPEPLLPLALGSTERLSVGCAGLLMKLHSTLRVANNFKLLATFFSDRVDLGYSAGSTGFNFLDNTFQMGEKDFRNQIKEINSFFLGDARSLFERNIPILPENGENPKQWLLTGGYNSLDLALELGLNLSRSLFHKGVEAMPKKFEIFQFKQQYFDKFGVFPKINLAFSALIHETLSGANKAYQTSIFSSNEFITPNFIGTPQAFLSLLDYYTETFGIDDFTILNLAETVQEKINTLSLLYQK
jgi:alkanesulfonate monooxygenase SsuD/methylene tetrahydromethanopterin reductase-like flavin-dependent oxidoreductase (luciferase family)